MAHSEVVFVWDRATYVYSKDSVTAFLRQQLNLLQIQMFIKDIYWSSYTLFPCLSLSSAHFFLIGRFFPITPRSVNKQDFQFEASVRSFEVEISLGGLKLSIKGKKF